MLHDIASIRVVSRPQMSETAEKFRTRYSQSFSADGGSPLRGTDKHIIRTCPLPVTAVSFILFGRHDLQNVTQVYHAEATTQSLHPFAQ